METLQRRPHRRYALYHRRHRLHVVDMGQKQHILLLLLLSVWFMLTGCSSRALHEAQDVVKTADSLRAEGVAYTDSMALAEAYNTLEKWQYLYPTDYARVCYYYGRLLRNNDDPVAAMQVFINGTHSHTRDYHILGRTYSNMGSICHLANEFQLSYDMYSRSADMFLKNGDTLLYYCLHSDMAFECAKQGKQNEVYSILGSMPEQLDNIQLQVKNAEAHLILCKFLHKYDSVLYYADSIAKLNGESPMQLISMAQAFCHLHQYDSATYYAQRTMASSSELFNLNNALYILIHCDSINNGYKVYGLSAERADIQKQIEIRQGKLSQAVQLLEQDLGRRPDMRWLYAVVGIILFVLAIGILYYIWRKRKQHHKLIIEVQEKKQEQNILEDSINNLSLLQTEKRKQIIEEVESVCHQFHDPNNIRKDLRWNDYEIMCSIVNFRMFGIVDQLHAYSLSEKEIRLCLLVLFQASTKQMVDLLPYAQSGLGKLKYTTARKLGTNTSNLRIFLLSMMK